MSDHAAERRVAVEPWLAQALDGVSQAPGAAPPDLALWELRGAMRSNSVEFDGGGRVEWHRRGGGQAERWRFLVAAPPAALRRLAGEGPRAGGQGSAWRALCSGMEDELRRIERESHAAARALEELGRTSGIDGATARIEVWGRRRAWRTGSAEPSADQGFGRRIRLAGAHGIGLSWTGSPEVEPPWTGREHARWRDELAWRAHLARAGVARDARDEYRGPMVLFPRAAGWWAHEMGHAALEQPSREFAVRHAARIVDDPAAGPWPAGFDRDDAGSAASPAVLWDGLGHHQPAPAGRRRRTSVRDAARPALSSTRLEIPARGAAADLASLPDGLPIAASVRAGRFDPISGRVVLEVDEAYVTESGACVPIPGTMVVEMETADAWRGLTPIRATCLDRSEQAWCTRRGSMHAVMVCAPTIVLDPVLARRSIPGAFRGTR